MKNEAYMANIVLQKLTCMDLNVTLASLLLLTKEKRVSKHQNGGPNSLTWIWDLGITVRFNLVMMRLCLQFFRDKQC